MAQKTQQLHPRALRRDIAQGRKDLAQLARRLSDATDAALLKSKQQLDGLERLRETLGYKATLRRGYAVVRAQDTVITSRQAAKAASGLEIEFADGRFALGEPRVKTARPPSKSSDQGSLF
ncbi:MAG: exodeoxyribonuclease VII large subunit [Paracoccaceae bacterium]